MRIRPSQNKLGLTHTLGILSVLGSGAVGCGTPVRVYDKLSFLAIFA